MPDNNSSSFNLRNPLKEWYQHSFIDSLADYDPHTDPRTDEYYLDFIKQYENDPMYSELLNNPYLIQNNADFSPNALQSIGEFFGDTSARDSYRANLISQRNQHFDLLQPYAQPEQTEYHTDADYAEQAN